MPIVFEEVVASVAPEPQMSAPPESAAPQRQRDAEPLSILLRRVEQRQERLRAD